MLNAFLADVLKDTTEERVVAVAEQPQANQPMTPEEARAALEQLMSLLEAPGSASIEIQQPEQAELTIDEVHEALSAGQPPLSAMVSMAFAGIDQALADGTLNQIQVAQGLVELQRFWVSKKNQVAVGLISTLLSQVNPNTSAETVHAVVVDILDELAKQHQLPL